MLSGFKRSRLNPPPQRQEQSLLTLQRRLLSNQLELEHEQIELLTARKAGTLRDVADLKLLVTSNSTRFRLTQQELDERLALVDQTATKISLQLEQSQARLHEILQQENAASHFAYTAAHEESQLLQQLLAEIGDVKECWRRRFALSNSTPHSADMVDWLQDAELAQQQLTRISEQLRLRTEQHQQQLAAAYRAQFSNSNKDVVTKWTSDNRSSEHQVEVYGELQVLINSGVRLYQRFIEDLRARQAISR